MTERRALEEVLRHFRIDGVFADATPHGSGHINRTYRVSFFQRGSLRHYLLQRVNTDIFQQPDLLMENIERVTSHLAHKLQSEPDAGRRTLTLIRTQVGHTWHRDADGHVWRVFCFVEDARTFDAVESPQQAFAAAQAFGGFQQQLADLPAPRLHETIPAFHDTPKRLQNFELAITEDKANRAAHVRAEIAFALSRRSVASILLDANLPERVTHNDTKLNNVMFDIATGEALCVVDLDTVMPGLALYDVGDMVRTATSPTAEDEQDLSKVGMNFDLFQALMRGYLSTAREFLTREEIDHLAVCGKVIAYEQALRFLDDYLRGDVYYNVSHPEQNLDRCRTQFKLIESIQQQERAMEGLVRSL